MGRGTLTGRARRLEEKSAAWTGAVELAKSELGRIVCGGTGTTLTEEQKAAMEPGDRAVWDIHIQLNKAWYGRFMDRFMIVEKNERVAREEGDLGKVFDWNGRQVGVVTDLENTMFTVEQACKEEYGWIVREGKPMALNRG
jgi:hypothetical protein